MRFALLAALACCSCTTIVINAGPDGSPDPRVDYPEAGGADASPPSDAAADSSLDDAGDGGLDAQEAAVDASTLCAKDPGQDGLCIGQTGLYYAWACPTAKTDLPKCGGDGGQIGCMCVNMGVDGGLYEKCCNVSNN